MLSKAADSMASKGRISSGFTSLALCQLICRQSISECWRLKEQA